MKYEEDNDLVDNEEELGDKSELPVNIEDEQIESWPDDLELNESAEKVKNTTPAHFSLKIRRAIEQHLEQRFLRKQLDYLFDDDFLPEDDHSSNKT